MELKLLKMLKNILNIKFECDINICKILILFNIC